MSVKVLVCRVGQQPKVEEVESPFGFCRDSLIDGGYVQIVTLEDGVDLLSDENGVDNQSEFNRLVPDRAKPLPAGFTMADVVYAEPELAGRLAQPGELGDHHVHGNFLLARHDYERDEPMSLTDDDIAKWTFNLTLP